MLNFESDLSTETYFIADIAANHDGSLKRAVELIELAARSGADAAKFQHFKGETIVSNRGFRELENVESHQSKWKKSVVEVYQDASVPLDWTPTLVKACEDNSIDFFTAPYDLDYIDYFADVVPCFKIGSGDITWHESLEKMASKGKPILLATGASEMREVREAIEKLQKYQVPILLMQCNTNYTGDSENINFLNLNVLKTYAVEFPDLVLGLSDHSPGHVSVLGAVALGARAVEKHFTDDITREGPDHGFSLDPQTWSEMVSDVRRLERMLGDGIKRVEENEKSAQIVQRRGLRYAKDFKVGHILERGDLIALRPCPKNALSPQEKELLVGRILNQSVAFDQLVQYSDMQ